MTIDSHQHFWKYTAADYQWIDESKAAIRRDFLPEDLRPLLQPAGVDAVISIEARQSLEETHGLLALANEHNFIRGVVGWVPLTSDRVKNDLETLGADPNLRGIRHALHTEADEQFILREDFNRGLALLKEFSLAFDILISARQLPLAVRLVDRHPDQIFVLDHIAWPDIRSGEREPWAKFIKEISRRTNVYCKVSGMVTQADWQSWTENGLREYFDITLDAFGAARLLAASDWPVCLLACGYKRWWEILRQWAAALSPAEQEQFLASNAIKAYGLK
jgi:L-fuconolactonase